MQIPTEWIKEFCGLNTTDDQMANQLTMAGVECELLSTSNQEILDLSLTPNRADCFSVLGICRELSVLNNLTIKTYNKDNLAVHHQDKINIEIIKDKIREEIKNGTFESFYKKNISNRESTCIEKTMPTIINNLFKKFCFINN